MARKSKIKVLLVDDSSIYRSTLGGLLATRGGFEVVGHASNGQEAIDFSKELRPDVVIMDVNMPILNGIDATRELLRLCPGAKVIAHTLESDEFTRRVCSRQEHTHTPQKLSSLHILSVR